MNRVTPFRAATFFVWFILATIRPQAAWAAEQPVDQAVVTKLTKAIEDEIYARGYETKYADLGEPREHGEHRLPVYIQPSISDGHGWTIYKLMPFGEIYRMYSVSKDGAVSLHGNPSNGFPPTQPDYLTLYMDDEDLCKTKNGWRKEYFSIELHPSAKRVTEARVHQRQLGSSPK
jgi:hypothetical protein